MAKVIKSTHPATGSNDWLKQKAVRGAEALITPLAKPSKDSDAAGVKFSKDVAKKRDAVERAEGKRLKTLPEPVKKQKPYTNPDGTPFTREQMRKHLGR